MKLAKGLFILYILFTSAGCSKIKGDFTAEQYRESHIRFHQRKLLDIEREIMWISKDVNELDQMFFNKVDSAAISKAWLDLALQFIKLFSGTTTDCTSNMIITPKTKELISQISAASTSFSNHMHRFDKRFHEIMKYKNPSYPLKELRQLKEDFDEKSGIVHDRIQSYLSCCGEHEGR